jgi:hypothetical protein
MDFFAVDPDLTGEQGRGVEPEGFGRGAAALDVPEDEGLAGGVVG